MMNIIFALSLITSALSFINRAGMVVDRMTMCYYNKTIGIFSYEALWQSGNTIESLSNYLLLTNQGGTPAYVSLIENTFQITPVIVDNCYDDHQWWLLGWVRAYEATGNVNYVDRAAQVFEFVVQNAWNASVCGGGIQWCPTGPAQTPYKNAVTNELFLSSAMALHPFTSILNKSSDYYLNWAIKEIDWLYNSGMQNAQFLFNDGLTNQCQNNGQTTWTYNQGVILSALGNLYLATQNSTYITMATNIINGVMNLLTDSNGILVEPCGKSCDGDQDIFKGVLLRHLGYLMDPTRNISFPSSFTQFVETQAASVLSQSGCKNGDYGSNWAGSCTSNLTIAPAAGTSSALDLFLTASTLSLSSNSSGFYELGRGICVDDLNKLMPSCSIMNIDEYTCKSAAASDPNAVAYDFQTTCTQNTQCNVRTLGGASSCLNGWTYHSGTATSIAGGDGTGLAICVVKQ
jgi:Glycosyl hydrolase family 76